MTTDWMYYLLMLFYYYAMVTYLELAIMLTIA